MERERKGGMRERDGEMEGERKEGLREREGWRERGEGRESCNISAFHRCVNLPCDINLVINYRSFLWRMLTLVLDISIHTSVRNTCRIFRCDSPVCLQQPLRRNCMKKSFGNFIKIEK